LAKQIKNRLYQEFAYEKRESVSQFIRQTPKGGWEIGYYPIRISTAAESAKIIKDSLSPIHIETSDGQKKSYQSEIHLSLPKGWLFEREPLVAETLAESKAGTKTNPSYGTRIPVGISSAIMLLHDLLTLCDGDQDFTSALLVQADVKTDWAVTKWHLGETLSVDFPWLPPPCATFWEYDCFAQSWKNVILNSRSGDVATPSIDVEYLFFIWVSAGTSVVNRRPPVELDSVGQANWAELLIELNDLKGEYDSDADRQDIFEWLINIALLIMPEGGLPSNCSKELLSSGNLQAFWKKQAPLIAQRRARRMSRMLKGGLEDLILELVRRTPGLFDSNTKPDMAAIYRYAGMEFGEEEKERQMFVELTARLDQLAKEMDKLSTLPIEFKSLKESFGAPKGQVKKTKKKTRGASAKKTPAKKSRSAGK
jgi:hypothetical protein